MNMNSESLCRECGSYTGNYWLFDTCISCSMSMEERLKKYRLTPRDMLDWFLIIIFLTVGGILNFFRKNSVRICERPEWLTKIRGFGQMCGDTKIWSFGKMSVVVVEDTWMGTMPEGHDKFLLIGNRVVLHWYKSRSHGIKYFKYFGHRVAMEKIREHKLVPCETKLAKI